MIRAKLHGTKQRNYQDFKSPIRKSNYICCRRGKKEQKISENDYEEERKQNTESTKAESPKLPAKRRKETINNDEISHRKSNDVKGNKKAINNNY